MSKPRTPNHLARLISRNQADYSTLNQAFEDAYNEGRHDDCADIYSDIKTVMSELDELYAELEDALGHPVPRR